MEEVKKTYCGWENVAPVNMLECANLISKIISFAGDVFPSVSYAQTQIPSYIPGCIGFILASLEKVSKIFFCVLYLLK